MSAHTTPERQRIISEPRTKKEIENALDAFRKLKEAIEEWEKKLAAQVTTAKELFAVIETLIQELEEQQPAIVRAVEQSYRKQQQSEETLRKAIEGIAKEVEKSREPTGDRLECGRDLGFERSVAASFYLVDASKEQLLPDTYTLPAMQGGFQIAFHFWIGTEKDKIRSKSQPAYITKPADLTYPITVQVTVWSDHFKFANCSQEIILPATGSSNHARFIIDKLPANTGPAELFVFLRHDGDLVGAFRVKVLVTEKPEEFQQAQIIEDIYLHGSWFRFQDGTSRSALTILITKKQANLQIFTLDATANPSAPSQFT